MRFTVLGPVRAWRGRTELELGPPKLRGLLALLLAQAGHPVATHEIVDLLWGQNPPGSAVNVVQRHIGALRRLLEPGLPARGTSRWLVRSAGGYRLEVPPDSLDLLRFRALRQEANSAADSGKPAEATGLLIEALDLWHGPAASGIPAEMRSQPVFVAVDGEHLAAAKDAAEQATKADPELGARVLAALGRAAAQYPLDEVLQARLMTVLAATGRQAEALDRYRAIRTRLADDLGVEPGPDLRAVHRQLLLRTAAPADPRPPERGGPDGHPEDPAGDVERPGVTTATAKPAQLPSDLAVFTGRRGELARVEDLLPTDMDGAASVVVTVIGGMAGVGKTTLAVHWAHQVAGRFPDGQLYVNLRGFHPTAAAMSTAEVIRSFLDALGVSPYHRPGDLDAQAALYRSLLADRRVLVVLDNARDSEQVRPLLPGTPGSLVIVTSRNQLYGLVVGEGAHSVSLGLLSEAEALEFLSRRIGADRVAREPRAVADIIAECERLPLALAIVSARAAMNPAFSLASVAAELRESRGSLDAFAAEAPLADARSAFSWSYSALTPAAARMFRLVSLHPGSEFSLAAAASLAGQRPGDVRPALAELVHARLLTESAPGRFDCHELLRVYGSELNREQDTAEESSAATCRVLDHYLHSAHAADSALAPNRERLEPPAVRAGVTVLRFADQRAAADWLDADRPALIAAIENDARWGKGEHSWRLAVALEIYLDRGGRWEEQATVQTAALSAARRLGDLQGQAHTRRALGFVSGRLGRWDEADLHLSRSLELFGRLGDVAGHSAAHRSSAFLANSRKRHEDALDHYRQARALYRASGQRGKEAYVLNEVGWTYILQGRYADALEECRQAIAIHEEYGDRNGAAAAWDSLGYAHHHLHHHDRALECFGKALELYRAVRDRYLEADTLVHIGETHHARGDHARAAHAWRQALDILQDIGHPEAALVRDRLESQDGVTRTSVFRQ